MTSTSAADQDTGAVDGERPLRRDAERNRGRILEAAREVFAARGLEATLNDIAHHANLGVGTVYRRFPNKDVLVEALFVERLQEIQAAAENALREPDPWDGLLGFMEWMTASLAQDRGLYEVSVNGSHGHRLVARARDDMCRCVAQLIERGEREGDLRPGASGTDVLAFMVMLGAVVEYARGVRPELWRRYLGIFLDGLRNTPDRQDTLTEPALSDAELDRAVYWFTDRDHAKPGSGA
ncbi:MULTISPECIES: TetR/AcrR family transcriptional regulator [unclassified Streptomyces]|uniref:TetR/AcrR family transcriptional regulator n=1 Tax=unclassified Streptomyces TaxID=2593676 RepID=UPI0036E0EE86